VPDRATIRDWVRQHTLIEDDDYADSKINNVIDEAVRDLSTQFSWPFLEASTTITLVDTQPNYALPADFATMNSAQRSDMAYLLKELHPRDAWARWAPDAGADKPTHFYFWGGDIYFAPTPTGPTLPDVTLRYYKMPTLMTNDTDTPEWDPQFHMLLAEFTAAKVWEREEDNARSQWHLERYYAAVERMARYYLNRAVDYPMVIGGGEDRKGYFPVGRMPWLEV
jgi:hypothetical protein